MRVAGTVALLALLISVTGIGTFLVLAVLGLGAVAALATLARP